MQSVFVFLVFSCFCLVSDISFNFFGIFVKKLSYIKTSIISVEMSEFVQESSIFFFHLEI